VRGLVDALLLDVRLAAGLLQPVVEEVVAFLERLHVGRALLPSTAVDVEVRQDPQEPRAEIRPGLERAPGPECA